MERTLIEQNPWWSNKEAIESDKHLIEYGNAGVRFPLPELKADKGVFIIRGPRQVGKTTLMKSMVREKLQSAEPESVFYFSAESGLGLEQAIREYLDFAGSRRKSMFLDEITQDEKWATRIKYFIDAGKISADDLVFVSGSSSIDLKAGAERLPGRYVEGREYLFYPYSFRDRAGVGAPACGIADFDLNAAKKLHLNEGLRSAFQEYARNGGLPTVWNTDRELARERYARWIEGMVARSKKSVIYTRELLAKLSQKTVFDFLGLAKETSIRSHHTVEEYLSFFEAGMLGKVIYNYSLALNAPDPKKEKKYVFIDPFISELFSSTMEEPLVVENIVGSHLLRVCDQLYFYRDKKSEIDFLCSIGGRLFPVEVKWRNDVSGSDARGMRKFGRGFLITKDTLDVFGDIIAVPAFVFLAMTGVTLARRRVL